MEDELDNILETIESDIIITPSSLSHLADKVETSNQCFIENSKTNQKNVNFIKKPSKFITLVNQ